MYVKKLPDIITYVVYVYLHTHIHIIGNHFKIYYLLFIILNLKSLCVILSFYRIFRITSHINFTVYIFALSVPLLHFLVSLFTTQSVNIRKLCTS